jgi:hypothetical protein
VLVDGERAGVGPALGRENPVEHRRAAVSP